MKFDWESEGAKEKSIKALKDGHNLFLKKQKKEKIEKRNDFLNKFFASTSDKKSVFEDYKRPGFYDLHKEEFKDKIIDYAGSPSGKAYIGINKTPFMPTNTGHGFMGVVLQDERRKLVQCSYCGKWMRKITDFHTKLCSGKTVEDYKNDFGILKTTGLVSDECSLKLTKAALKNKTNNGNIKNCKKTKIKKYERKVEVENRFGTCPLQLKTRLYEFIICNRELPNEHNRGKALYKAIRLRFGRFGDALKEYGLPTLKRIGTNYVFTFPDWSKQKFNINRIEERTALFDMLVEKCKELKNQLINF